MQILWDKGEAFVSELLEAMPEPRPAYNTVSTIVRILEKGWSATRPSARATATGRWWPRRRTRAAL